MIEEPKTRNKIIHKMSSFISGVPKNLLHSEREDAGFHFGKRKILSQEYTIAKSAMDEGNICVLGGTGSGKTSCLVKPTLETWDGSIFAIDVDGELYKHWQSLDKPNKKPAKVINLTNDNGSFSTYDPFYFLRQSGKENLVQNCRELAQCIIPMSLDVKEPFWIESAQCIVAAVILYYLSKDKSFNKTMEFIQAIPLATLIEGICSDKNETAKTMVGQFSESNNLKNNKMLLSVASTISNRIIAFAIDPTVKAALTPSEGSVKWEDLETHNIFIRVEQSKLDQWGSVITMMLTQLIRSLERRPNKYSTEGIETTPILLIFDEFPRIGKMSVITTALATLRIKKVTIALFIQSLSQLDMIYETEQRKIIMDNCSCLVVLSVDDVDTQKYISERIGDHEVLKFSYSMNSDNDGLLLPLNANASWQYEPIIHASELSDSSDIKLIFPGGFCRVDKAPSYKRENLNHDTKEVIKEINHKIEDFKKSKKMISLAKKSKT